MELKEILDHCSSYSIVRDRPFNEYIFRIEVSENFNEDFIQKLGKFIIEYQKGKEGK